MDLRATDLRGTNECFGSLASQNIDVLDIRTRLLETPNPQDQILLEHFRILFQLGQWLDFNNLIKEYVVPYMLYKELLHAPDDDSIHIFLDFSVIIENGSLDMFCRSEFARNLQNKMLLPYLLSRMNEPGDLNIDVWLICVRRAIIPDLINLMQIQWQMAIATFTNLERVMMESPFYEHVAEKVITLELSLTKRRNPSPLQLVGSLIIDPYKQLVQAYAMPRTVGPILLYNTDMHIVGLAPYFMSSTNPPFSASAPFRLRKTYGTSQWRFRYFLSNVRILGMPARYSAPPGPSPLGELQAFIPPPPMPQRPPSDDTSDDDGPPLI